MTTVDLRSDTVTQPTAAMREAMMAAPLGDDVFGDDPSVQALQERVAAITGKEAALFMPSGTQSNLCAMLAHCERGDEYIVGQNAHTYRYEGGGAAVLGSIQPQPLAQNATGQMLLADIAAAIKPDDPHFARTRLLCLENTWNGHPMPAEYLDQATALAREHGLAVHLDGARVFNAAVAAGGDPCAAVRDIVDRFDSVSVCFSKGLGAPVGSALCGSKDLIRRALRWRKMLGGGLRQSGLLAAAAHHALDHHIHRLADDHALAQRLAKGLAGIDGLSVRSAQTNIVFVDVANGRGPDLLAHLARDGVLATGLIGLRFVTHLDVDAAGIDRAIASTRAFFAQGATAASARPAGSAVY
ncbi:low-specificity L-threonine aldolase [Hydrogenophaga sp. PBL-H3]|uniref:low-specificity L-threonine aldolase n=1 Tax=Hydrogenophaga sp. PBL-H3 TaxID=434010 RepID=UPI00131F6DDF|nr:low-specificity L-threonine aldolase [Hydrogenophaga sp. PBL-H3]QHE74967.1 low-specificity L-threonine aldolase [Hydrogenophaga sp. PBL-H3]QHE79394.1 low-specificity L-threonine aldolase [Hydrogenophaga sp. PBL-H3]